MNWIRRAAFVIGAVCLAAGCSTSGDNSQTLTLATTTSTRDSGLLDALLPVFEEQTGVSVKVVAVGSGQALELGRRGDADVLLTHAPAGEEQFVAEGHAESCQSVMHNDFVLVGPPANPAGIQKDLPIAETFCELADSEATFVSRGDDSGTHRKERAVWKAASREPEGAWYVQAGGGMAEVLRIASEKNAYTLADRSTFLAQRSRNELVIVAEGDPLLRNPYAVMVVSPRKHPGVNEAAAQKFAQFLRSPETRGIIQEFGVEKFGQPLFYVSE